jgi:hypothetical protein
MGKVDVNQPIHDQRKLIDVLAAALGGVGRPLPLSRREHSPKLRETRNAAGETPFQISPFARPRFSQ